jgi:glycosyltransferase involved in cell wall biosynthesis
VNIWKELQAARAAAIVPTQVPPLAATLKEWLGSEAVRRGHADRGRAFARERYDWTNIARRWAGHYARIAAGRAGTDAGAGA